MTHRKTWLLVVALLSLLGCDDEAHDDDDDDGGRDPVSSSEACADICTGMRRARCSVDLGRCEALCAQQYAATPASCLTLADQLLDCASKATYSCGAEGPEATFCASLEAKLDSCIGGGSFSDAGTVTPSFDAGLPPSTTSDASTPAIGDGSVSSARDASGPVNTADASVADASVADAAVKPDAAVPATLSCQIAAEDEACDRCIKTSCCSALTACGRDCQALGACIADCSTDACFDRCYAQHPAGEDQFDAVLECSAVSCESSCDDTEPPTMGVPRPPPADRCLPTFAPAGTCSDPQKPIGYDCKGQPFADCVALPNISDVYCCGL